MQTSSLGLSRIMYRKLSLLKTFVATKLMNTTCFLDHVWQSAAPWSGSQCLHSLLKDPAWDGVRVSHGIPDSWQGRHCSAKGMDCSMTEIHQKLFYSSDCALPLRPGVRDSGGRHVPGHCQQGQHGQDLAQPRLQPCHGSPGSQVPCTYDYHSHLDMTKHCY